MSQAPFERKLGKARIAGGLAWTPMMGEVAPKVREEFKRHLKANKAEWGAVAGIADHQRYAMGGVVSPIKGGPPPTKFRGAIPAAIWFAASGTQPRVYVEKVGNDRFWLLASLGNDVDPRTDQVLTRDDLVALVNEFGREAALAGHDLSLTIWPSTEEMPEGINIGSVPQAKPLESCLTHSAMPSAHIRKHVGIPPWVGRAAVGCAALAVVAYGANVAYQGRQDRLAAEAQAAMELARLEQERRAREAAESGRPDPMALAQGGLEAALASPSPVALIESCLELASDLPELAGGWRLSSIVCEPGHTARATYDQQAGIQGQATQASFSQAMNDLDMTFTYDWFARTASVRFGQIDLEPRLAPQVAELPDAQSVGTWWASHATTAQSVLQGVKLSVDSQPSLPESDAPVAYAWRALQIAGSASWQMREVIPDQTNLALHSITLTARQQSAWSWSVVGALYHSQESL